MLIGKCAEPLQIVNFSAFYQLSDERPRYHCTLLTENRETLVSGESEAGADF